MENKTETVLISIPVIIAYVDLVLLLAWSGKLLINALI
jgi:hypothetical protein